MKKTLLTHDIAKELHEDKNSTWSWCGAVALAEHLEDLERDLGEETELDVIAVRCEFSEYESLAAWALDYFGGESLALEELALESLEDADDVIRDYVIDRGTLLEFSGGIIVSSF